MEFQHIVEPPPPPPNEEVRKDGETRDKGAPPRKCLRDDLPLTRGAICLTGIVLIGSGVFEWAGIGPAVAAVGAAILYAQGTRFR